MKITDITENLLSRMTPLSPREREVRDMLSGGMTVRQVARQLCIAQGTVLLYQRRIKAIERERQEKYKPKSGIIKD